MWLNTIILSDFALEYGLKNLFGIKKDSFFESFVDFSYYFPVIRGATPFFMIYNILFLSFQHTGAFYDPLNSAVTPFFYIGCFVMIYQFDLGVIMTLISYVPFNQKNWDKLYMNSPFCNPGMVTLVFQDVVVLLLVGVLIIADAFCFFVISGILFLLSPAIVFIIPLCVYGEIGCRGKFGGEIKRKKVEIVNELRKVKKEKKIIENEDKQKKQMQKKNVDEKKNIFTPPEAAKMSEDVEAQIMKNTIFFARGGGNNNNNQQTNFSRKVDNVKSNEIKHESGIDDTQTTWKVEQVQSIPKESDMVESVYGD